MVKGANMNDIPGCLTVTPYYRDKAQHGRDTQVLRRDSHLAVDLARRGEAAAAQEILLRWALTCVRVGNKEARLALVVMGHNFLEGYLRLNPEDWNSGVFRVWVQYVYAPAARAESESANNHGSWGLLGLALSSQVLGEDAGRVRDRLTIHMGQTWDARGRMVHEIKRTNSGIWYSYFSLAPLLRACQVLRHPDIWGLYRPLNWLWRYVQDPLAWPYRLPAGLWGKIRRLWHPCADELELPRPNDWPANLYLEAARQFNEPAWAAYARRPFNDGVHIYRESYFSGGL